MSRQEQKIADKKQIFVIFFFKCCLNSILYVWATSEIQKLNFELDFYRVIDEWLW